MIQMAVRGLGKSFSTLRVLDGVNLDVERGEVLSLIGPSGSGKSTLLRCLNLLEVPDEGELLWEGQPLDYRGAGENELCRHRTRMGMVFQHFELFGHLNVLDNIIEAPQRVLGLSREEASERAIGLLSRVGLSEKESSWPAQLSGGQKQRGAIARALAMEPAALLLDEVTSALDVEMVAGINALLSELARDMTMLAVTHDLSFAASVSTRVAFMEGGRLVEIGPPDQVLKAPESQRARAFISAIRR